MAFIPFVFSLLMSNRWRSYSRNGRPSDISLAFNSDLRSFFVRHTWACKKQPRPVIWRLSGISMVVSNTSGTIPCLFESNCKWSISLRFSKVEFLLADCAFLHVYVEWYRCTAVRDVTDSTIRLYLLASWSYCFWGGCRWKRSVDCVLIIFLVCHRWTRYVKHDFTFGRGIGWYSRDVTAIGTTATTRSSSCFFWNSSFARRLRLIFLDIYVHCVLCGRGKRFCRRNERCVQQTYFTRCK